ncbi:MAG TPA: hypothetical protein PLI05_00620 [Methanotrichaceae archaeon]|nr:hypothetical protein [Methanotrichaceae archaeon]HQF15553.1 hypothetical protein [Methanotrichaceae archaeon]HQI90289.1 hypothetical protein [Methanotrichaceae archaeon]HQJ27743.1 hypothetical protein [Methanotrichaceae archaeon]
MRKVIVLLAIMALIGVSAAAVSDLLRPEGWYTAGDYPDERAYKNVTFNFEQSVQGSGYWMTYRYAKAGALAVHDYVHGSGSIDNEVVMYVQDSLTETHPYDADWNDYLENCISLKEDNVMVYSPMQIAIGTGYYAANPILFDSLLKEKIWIKNYRAATSMHHEIEYAHGIDKEVDVLAKEKFNHTYDPEFFGVGYIQMKVNEHVDDGRIHFGVLKGAIDRTAEPYVAAYESRTPESFFAKNAWKNPAIEIDEDYFGTYDIVKNMTLETPYKLVQKNPDWLPCLCDGGYDDFDYRQPAWYKGMKPIFDCTCYKVPSEAEFQRE